MLLYFHTIFIRSLTLLLSIRVPLEPLCRNPLSKHLSMCCKHSLINIQKENWQFNTKRKKDAFFPLAGKLWNIPTQTRLDANNAMRMKRSSFRFLFLCLCFFCSLRMNCFQFSLYIVYYSCIWYIPEIVWHKISSRKSQMHFSRTTADKWLTNDVKKAHPNVWLGTETVLT